MHPVSAVAAELLDRQLIDKICGKRPSYRRTSICESCWADRTAAYPGLMSDGTRNPEAHETQRFADQLRIAEYESVRQEWLASRDVQQHTLQWTFAASAVLLAGILSSDARSEEPFLYIALAAATAALSIFSQAVWFGEVVRMERAALFLRGLEASVADLVGETGTRAPLTWETWRSNPPPDRTSPWIPPARTSIVGGFALFLLLSLAAVVILLTVVFDNGMPSGDRIMAGGFALLAIVLYVVANLEMCSQALDIFKIRGHASGFIDPRSMRRKQDS